MKPGARLLSGNHKTEIMQNFFNAKAQRRKDFETTAGNWSASSCEQSWTGLLAGFTFASWPLCAFALNAGSLKSL